MPIFFTHKNLSLDASASTDFCAAMQKIDRNNCKGVVAANGLVERVRASYEFDPVRSNVIDQCSFHATAPAHACCKVESLVCWWRCYLNFRELNLALASPLTL